MVGHLGLIARFDATTATLIIQQPRTIYSNKFPKRADDPFGRTLPGGRSLPFRLFVWGRNLQEAKIKRKFTKAGPTTIEVRSYSTTQKRYLIERYIDEGGMQFVYAARDKLADRVVALKTPKNKSATKRFRRSAIVAAKVNHPNVAKTLDHIRDGDDRYLIEELIVGADLSQALLRKTT